MNTLTRYYLKSKLTGQIHTKEYYLKQVENAGLSKLFDVFNYDIIKRAVWTQLTDKNGAKIFEGDLVKYFIHTYKVGFYNGTFGLFSIEHVGFTPFFDSINMSCEIIGNIHEGDK